MKFLLTSGFAIATSVILFSCKKQDLTTGNNISNEHLSAPNGNFWTYKTTFPVGTRRGGAGCFVINGKAYIFGGIDQSNNYKKDLWEYDPVANIWTQKTGLSLINLPRAFVATFVINNKGYIVGGQTSISITSETPETWEYDPSQDMWTQKQSLPMARSQACGFAINGKGYIAMGTNYALDRYISTVLEFDPVANTWTYKSELVSGSGDMGRYSASAFVVNNKAYIGLGTKSPENFYDEFFDLWSFDPATNTWAAKANFPALFRSSASAYSAGSIGYVGCGVSDLFSKRDFYSYNPSTNAWTQRASVPGIFRSGAVSFYIGNYGYLGLGFGAGADPTEPYIYRYTAGNPLSPSVQN